MTSRLSFLRRFDRFFLDGPENWFQEAPILVQRRLIVGGKGGLYRIDRRWSQDFQATHKDTHNLRRCRDDPERQNPIDEAAGYNIDQAAALFEPGVAPSLYHRV